MKRRNFIIVSTKIDILIQEQIPDANVQIFRSVQELGEYIEINPLRGDTMFITRDVLGQSVNTRLTQIFNYLENIFLKVDKVEYITEVNSDEIPSIEFIIEDRNIENWQVHQVEGLTREKVTGLISGTLKSDDIVPKRKAMYRIRRSEFIKSNMDKSGDEMETPFLSEEELLEEIPDVLPEVALPSEVHTQAQIKTITGLDTKERTMFSLLFAQYLSYSEKTLICERDFTYLRLTELAHKMRIQHLAVDIEDLFVNTQETLAKIRNTTRKLIVITAKNKCDYSYNFVISLLYANLKDDITYLVKENDLHEVAESASYITCMENTIIDIIRTCELLPNNYSTNAKFVAIDTTRIKEMSIPNSEALGHVISELLQIEAPYVPIYKISSLRGGNTAGLRVLT